MFLQFRNFLTGPLAPVIISLLVGIGRNSLLCHLNFYDPEFNFLPPRLQHLNTSKQMLSSHDSLILRAFVENMSKASLQPPELQHMFNCCTKLHCMDLIQSLLMSKEEKLPLTPVRFRSGSFLTENDYALMLLNIYDEKRQQIQICEQTRTKQRCQQLKYQGRWAFKICHSISIVQFKGSTCTQSSERMCVDKKPF